MDNYVNHLLNTIKEEKEISKVDDRNIVKIIFKAEYQSAESYLESISESYAIILEIIKYLKENKGVEVHKISDDIIIIFK